MTPQNPPVIVIKKTRSHDAHHGGAWKVAYADFATAMMALFIVLWLLNSGAQVRKAVSAYFNDPSGSRELTGSSSAGTGDTLAVDQDNMQDLKQELEYALKRSPEFEKTKDYVKMNVTGEGLRVELLEDEKGMFFQSGSSSPSENGKDIIAQLARELGKLPNQLLIEGHTDARPFSRGDYSNWELSTERANASRRLMESSGLRPGQIVQVRGFAANELRDREHPESAANRRVSVIVRYQPGNGPSEKPAEAVRKK